MANVFAIGCLMAVTVVAMREGEEVIPKFAITDECCGRLCSDEKGQGSCTAKCTNNMKDIQQTVNLHVCTRTICKGLSNRDKVEMEEAKLSDEELQSLGDEAENAFPFAGDVSLVEAQGLQDELASMLQFKTDSSAMGAKEDSMNEKPLCSYPCDFCGEFCTALGEGFLVHRLCKWKCMWNIKAFHDNKQEYCDACAPSTNCDKNQELTKKGCTNCKPGWFSDEGAQCGKCPKGKSGSGTDKDDENALGCKVCKAEKNLYTNKTGETKCSTCVDANTHSVGGVGCALCDAGRTAPNCEKCVAGKYHASANATKCTPCAAGTHQGSAGATKCDSCDPQHWSPEGAKQCAPCRKGNLAGVPASVPFYSDAEGECHICDTNYQLNSSRTGCEKCPNGTDGSETQGMCASCTDGKHNQEPGETCKECDPNQISEDRKTCKNCPAGKHRERGGKACVACPTGTWCAAGASPVYCDKGQTTKWIAHTFETSGCDNASYCTNCSKGKHSVKDDKEDKGQTCVDCEVGTYQAKPGTSACQKCDDGKTTNGKGNTDASSCRAELCEKKACGGKCAPGWTNLKKKLKLCEPCIPGCSDCDMEGHNTRCQKCFDGYYLNGYNCEACTVSRCTNCVADKDKCTSCSQGYEPSTDNKSCKAKAK